MRVRFALMALTVNRGECRGVKTETHELQTWRKEKNGRKKERQRKMLFCVQFVDNEVLTVLRILRFDFLKRGGGSVFRAYWVTLTRCISCFSG